MKLYKDTALKFDSFMPIYNWFYPLSNAPLSHIDCSQPLAVFDQLSTSQVRKRAVYLHIPFCDTICSFCPFVRGKFTNYDTVKRYTKALIKEIQIKSKYKSISSVPIGSIFIGGGTPSILDPEDIRDIGHTLKECFDLSGMEEFSCEMEVKSVTEEKNEAFKSIGVTHARFGLQTFNSKYRDLFTLTATLEQTYSAIDSLKKTFPFVSFDMLYGMHGQTEEEFVQDIHHAVETGANNIDFYPINNLMTQVSLHSSFNKKGLQPTSGLTKYYMNMLLREYMRSNQYLPHNGHGYVRVTRAQASENPVLTDTYSFKYHDYVYGYSDHELIGFGANAISSLNNFSFFNTASREGYIKSLLADNVWDFSIGMHSSITDASKPVILRLPYHGRIERSKVDWQHVHPATLQALSDLIDCGLVVESADSYQISRDGWYWYVNMMYFLSPPDEKREIEKFINKKKHDRRRSLEEIGI